MNSKTRSLLAGLVVASAFSIPAFGAPDLTISNLSTTTLVNTGSGPQWTPGMQDVSASNFTIGPGLNSINVLFQLNGDLTTGTGNFTDFGAGIIVDPAVAPGDEIFGFSLQLMDGGNAVGNPFGFDLTNSFTFPVTDVTTGELGEPAGVTFDAVDMTVYNNTQTESVKGLDVFIGLPGAAPDTASTLALLAGGLVMLLAARPKTRHAS